MQTPAEKHLLATISSFLYERQNNDDTSRILNIGAGKSLFIENSLIKNSYNFVCDRIDIENYKLENKFIRHCYQCSVESMNSVKSNQYNLAFANYVLEHTKNLDQAASEIYRVLKLGGIFVATIPNPTAPEFLLAKQTPLWFHRKIRGTDAWETHYAFKNINALITLFEKNGFNVIEVLYWSYTSYYLERFKILSKLSNLYDKFLNNLQLKRFMNNVCVSFKKTF